MLCDDIKLVEKAVVRGFRDQDSSNAWERIKKELAEALTKAPNNARDEILLCSYPAYDCGYRNKNNTCQTSGNCNGPRKTSPVAANVVRNKLFFGDYMRKKLYDEFVAECESSCMDMYIAWLEERVFALDAKVEKFTSYNKQSAPCSFRAKCPVDKGPGCERVEPRPCFVA